MLVKVVFKAWKWCRLVLGAINRSCALPARCVLVIYGIVGQTNIVCAATSVSVIFTAHKPYQIHMGYWPSVRSRWLDIGKVFFLACLRTETKSRSVNTQKRTRPISSHRDRTSLVNKGFIILFLLRLRGNFSCRTQRVIPSGQDSSILPSRVANHSAGFGSSCPLTELAI